MHEDEDRREDRPPVAVQVRQPRKLKEAATDMLSVATYFISPGPLFPRGAKATVYNGVQLAEQRPQAIKEA